MDASKKFNEDLNRFGSLLYRLFEDEELFKSDPKSTEEFEELRDEIFDYLLWYPGSMVFVSSQSEKERNEFILKVLHDIMEPNDIFTDIASGGYSGYLALTIGELTDKLKELKPTFITIEPKDEKVMNYFQEAMKSWLYGIHIGALIICQAVIEDILKDRLQDIDDSMVYEYGPKDKPKKVWQTSYKDMLNNALSVGLINEKQYNSMDNIRRKRNKATHRLYTYSDKQVYKVIMDTKEVVQDLLSQKDQN